MYGIYHFSVQHYTWQFCVSQVSGTGHVSVSRSAVVGRTMQHNTLLPLILVRSQIKSMLGGERGKSTWQEQSKNLGLTVKGFLLCAVHWYVVRCTLVRCALYTGTLCAVHWYVVRCTLVRCVLYTGTLCAVHWYVANVWASRLLQLCLWPCLSREGMRCAF